MAAAVHASPRQRPDLIASSPAPDSLHLGAADLVLDAARPPSARSRIEALGASSLMDDAHSQLESLHRQVFALTKQSRARSAFPWKSAHRSRTQKATIAEMESGASLARFDIDVTGEQVRALTGRQTGTVRRHIADLVHRLKDADAIGQYARRQGSRILTEIDDRIADLVDRIDKRMAQVEGDERMPRSKASLRCAHYLALLDDRLDKSRRWNNGLRTQNTALRRRIADLNLERRTDLAMLSRLGQSVADQRAAIRTLLDGVCQAELAHAASQAEMAPLDAQYRAETAAFAADWARTAELEERHRALEDEIIRMKGEMYFGDDDRASPDHSIQMIMSRTAWRIAKDKALLEVVSARHGQLRDLVDELQRLTDTTSFDDIVARFERSNTDQLVQYATLQSLIVELADLQRRARSSPSIDLDRTGPAIDARPNPDAVEQRSQHLEQEVASLRDVFASMTKAVANTLARLNASGVSTCSQAIGDRLATVGVTVQNVESIVSGIEVGTRALLERIDGGVRSDGAAVVWRDPSVVEHDLCIAVPSANQHQDDDDVDFR